MESDNMRQFFNDNGKLVERQGRKAAGLKHNATTAGLPKEGEVILITPFFWGVFVFLSVI